MYCCPPIAGRLTYTCMKPGPEYLQHMTFLAGERGPNKTVVTIIKKSRCNIFTAPYSRMLRFSVTIFVQFQCLCLPWDHSTLFFCFAVVFTNAAIEVNFDLSNILLSSDWLCMLSLGTSLLCIVGELAGGQYFAIFFGTGD